MQHLQPNTTLQGGKYRIERVLGQGGFGITYLARNTVFDIDVAIKEFFMKDENDRDGSSVIMPNTTKQELFHGQMEKFKKEAKRMFSIKNEHIVGVQDLFEENGTAYYVMDFVEGENLAERLKRTGKPMTEQEVRDILPQILNALKVVHEAGIWHLDLKPANIMLDKEGNVKLIDFGASKQLNAQKGGATTSTAISYTKGYAPREQMEQNYDKFGPWTDIYALGATLYNLLTNKRPPMPSDIDDDMSQDKHLTLPMPETAGGLKNLVLQMMKTNRKQRPQSIDAIISAVKSRDKAFEQIPVQQEPLQDGKTYEDEGTIVEEPKPKNGTNKGNTHPQIPDSPVIEEEEPPSSKGISPYIGIAGIVFVVIILVFSYREYGKKTSIEEPVPAPLKVDSIYDTNSDANADTDIVYDVVEVMPEYPGGMNALMSFLSDNIIYPEEAEEKGIEGRVLITFIVEKNGSVSNVEVAESVNPLLDKEAVRVVKTMKKWIPGKQNNEPARVRYTLPISFVLK